MIKIILALTIVLAANNAMAEEQLLAACYGDHHGTYLDVVSRNGKLVLKTSSDGEGAPEYYTITKMTKSYTERVQRKDYAETMLKAMRASSTAEDYDFVMVHASKFGSKLILNLNKFMGGENFIVSDGYVEKLECPATK